MNFRSSFCPPFAGSHPADFYCSDTLAMSTLSAKFALSTPPPPPPGLRTKAVRYPRPWGFAPCSCWPLFPHWLLVIPSQILLAGLVYPL